MPLEIEVPLDGLTFLPVDGAWQTELELRVAVEDGRGWRNEIAVVPVRPAFPKRPPPGRHAVYETAVKLRDWKHTLVVSLFDPVSGERCSGPVSTLRLERVCIPQEVPRVAFS